MQWPPRNPEPPVTSTNSPLMRASLVSRDQPSPSRACGRQYRCRKMARSISVHRVVELTNQRSTGPFTRAPAASAPGRPRSAWPPAPPSPRTRTARRADEPGCYPPRPRVRSLANPRRVPSAPLIDKRSPDSPTAMGGVDPHRHDLASTLLSCGSGLPVAVPTTSVPRRAKTVKQRSRRDLQTVSSRSGARPQEWYRTHPVHRRARAAGCRGSRTPLVRRGPLEFHTPSVDPRQQFLSLLRRLAIDVLFASCC